MRERSPRVYPDFLLRERFVGENALGLSLLAGQNHIFYLDICVMSGFTRKGPFCIYVWGRGGKNQICVRVCMCVWGASRRCY